jgi:hypothetical protein
MQIDPGFTALHEQTLRAQVFGDLSPGPLLHDFQVVLDHLGTDGVKAAGKYNLLPIEAIPVLDERLVRPLRLELRRPQLRSHPYLQGLHLLLRATGLVRVRGDGAKSRLAPDPAMLQRWQELNPTERYFSLLESCFLISDPAMIGEREGGWNRTLQDCLVEWRWTPDSGRKLWTGKGRPDMIYLRGLGRRFYLLALLDLFGLLHVEHPKPPPQRWAPAEITRTPFGDATFTLLADAHYQLLFTMPFGGRGPQDETDDEEPTDGETDEAEAPEQADEACEKSLPDRYKHWLDLPDESAGFGFWQPLFQPYVAAWQQTLTMAPPLPQKGVYVFRVSLGGVRREIAMPDDATADELVQWILKSVQFDSDHLYQLTYRDHLGRTMKLNHPYCSEPPSADEFHIGELRIDPGAQLKLQYDFGDNWYFDIRLDRIETGARKRAPRILSRKGAAPKQYESW